MELELLVDIGREVHLSFAATLSAHGIIYPFMDIVLNDKFQVLGKFFMTLFVVAGKFPHFEMDMGTGRPPGIAGKGDDRLAIHAIARRYFNQGIMAVQGQNSISMINRNQVSVAFVGTGIIDGTLLHRVNRRSFGNGNINPPMIDLPAAAKGVKAPADTGGDPAAINGHSALRKACRGKQQQKYQKDE